MRSYTLLYIEAFTSHLSFYIFELSLSRYRDESDNRLFLSGKAISR